MDDGDVYIWDSQTKSTTFGCCFKLEVAESPPARPPPWLFFQPGIDFLHSSVRLTVYLTFCIPSRSYTNPLSLFANHHHVSQTIRSCHPLHPRSLCRTDQTSPHQL